jgi:hypothetical protein
MVEALPEEQYAKLCRVREPNPLKKNCYISSASQKLQPTQYTGHKDSNSRHSCIKPFIVAVAKNNHK